MGLNATQSARCALCLRNRSLLLSHIIPAFVIRYLKKTSATGYLRSPLNPDLRKQDISKVRLLCEECEQLFSGWERTFSLEAFPKIQSEVFDGFGYGPWFLKFAVSLSWRTLVVDRPRIALELPQFAPSIDSHLENWRRFLVSEQNQPGSVHHMLALPEDWGELPQGVHPKFLHYCLRTAEATEAVGKRNIGVFVKLIRACFYSPIVPAFPSGWVNTRIHAGTGRIITPQKPRRGFADFLNSRTGVGFDSPFSDAQIRKISQTLLENPNRALKSETFKVHRASKQLTDRN